MPAPAGGREVKVDVTIREHLAFPLKQRPVLRGYREYSDLPQGAKVRVYSLEEIASEKVVALLDRARNEPRDLYDVWYLVTDRHVDLGDVVGSIEKKLEFRGKSLKKVQAEFAAKEARFKRLWEPRLSAQVAELPEFVGVYRAVQHALRQAGIAGR